VLSQAQQRVSVAMVRQRERMQNLLISHRQRLCTVLDSCLRRKQTLLCLAGVSTTTAQHLAAAIVTLTRLHMARAYVYTRTDLWGARAPT
jgi:phosphoheptose isomerase